MDGRHTSKLKEELVDIFTRAEIPVTIQTDGPAFLRIISDDPDRLKEIKMKVYCRLELGSIPGSVEIIGKCVGVWLNVHQLDAMATGATA